VTSILDSPVPLWSDRRIQELRSVLASAYGSLQAIRDLVSTVPAFPANRITWDGSGGTRAAWGHVMDAAAMAGLTRKLLDAVLADGTVRAIHPDLRSRIAELEAAAPAEPVSIAGLAVVLAADLPQLADQFVKQIQRLASRGDQLSAALAADAALGTVRSIGKALTDVDDVGSGSEAETAFSDTDIALRQEIHRQLNLCKTLLAKTSGPTRDTVPLSLLAVAAGHLQSSATRLADLRLRQQHPL
jgi:Effector-associated domain 1